MKKLTANLFNIVGVALIIFILAKKIPVWWQNYHQEGLTSGEFRVQSLAGERVVLPLKDSQPAVLIFWATWCGPCHYQMVEIQKLIDKKEIPADRVFAVDLGESQATVAAFVKQQNYTFPVFLDSEDEGARLFNIQGTPTLIHLNADASIRWMTAGVNPLNNSKMKDLLGTP